MRDHTTPTNNRYTHKDIDAMSQSTHPNPVALRPLTILDRYVEGIWFLEYTVPNIDDDDPLGDGSNRYVRTLPYGAPIRVSLLATLERDDAPDAASTWHAPLMYRYWGSADLLGRDDHKNTYLVCGNNAEEMRVVLTDIFTKCQSHAIDIDVLVTPLRYVPVGGSGTQVVRAFRSMGIALTSHETGRAVALDAVQRGHPRTKTAR